MSIDVKKCVKKYGVSAAYKMLEVDIKTREINKLKQDISILKEQIKRDKQEHKDNLSMGI